MNGNGEQSDQGAAGAPIARPGDPALPGARQRVTRFAHLSDMHVEPDLPGLQARHSDEGLVAALRSVAQLDPRPDFIVTGGDHIMDALERPHDDVHRQWELYRRIMAAHCPFKSIQSSAITMCSVG